MTVSGTYLEVDRPRALAYTWMPSWEKELPATEVRYTLSPVSGGTLVQVEHTGFEGFPAIAARSRHGLEASLRMARRILHRKGGKMRLLYLCILAISSLATAQEAPAHFLIEFELTAGVDIAHLSQPQMAVFQQHGAQLMKLRNDGVVIVGGHTDNMQHMRAFVIVKAKDAAAARTRRRRGSGGKGRPPEVLR